jgi:hypothetical protein
VRGSILREMLTFQYRKTLLLRGMNAPHKKTLILLYVNSQNAPPFANKNQQLLSSRCSCERTANFYLYEAFISDLFIIGGTLGPSCVGHQGQSFPPEISQAVFYRLMTSCESYSRGFFPGKVVLWQGCWQHFR